MQSKEHDYAAQGEGFAHFIAADLFNAAPSDPVPPNGQVKLVLYPKEFKWGPNDVDLPPVQLMTILQYGGYANWAWYRWRYTYCRPNTYRNTELDWHQAFYNLRYYGSKSFSMTDFADIYKECCGGMCVRATSKPRWIDLQTAIRAIFGQNSDQDLVFGDVLLNHRINWDM